MKERWQRPELTGQRFRTKLATSQFKHSPTSTPEHPIGLQVLPILPSRKVLARLGLEPGCSVYMTDALPTELLTMPAEMSETMLTDGSQALLQVMAFSPTNLGSQYVMKGRIHNNYEGWWQHPELSGQRFGTKSVTSQFKHSLTPTP